MGNIKIAKQLFATLVLTLLIHTVNGMEQVRRLDAPQFIKIAKLFNTYAGLAIPNNPRMVALYALYKCHIKPSALNRLQENGETYLMYAVRQQDIDAVNALIALPEIDLNQSSINEQSALDIALEIGNDEIASLLSDKSGMPSVPTITQADDSDDELDDEDVSSGDESGLDSDDFDISDDFNEFDGSESGEEVTILK